eukprot:GHVT01029161.1.p1 GENE.GHVT01029161.1~~GHVT01029161.1.p1  ORF type:complete len:206 (-),score=10.63 GHVT01029161.1:1381-1998(-)
MGSQRRRPTCCPNSISQVSYYLWKVCTSCLQLPLSSLVHGPPYPLTLYQGVIPPPFLQDEEKDEEALWERRKGKRQMNSEKSHPSVFKIGSRVITAPSLKNVSVLLFCFQVASVRECLFDMRPRHVSEVVGLTDVVSNVSFSLSPTASDFFFCSTSHSNPFDTPAAGRAACGTYWKRQTTATGSDKSSSQRSCYCIAQPSGAPMD